MTAELYLQIFFYKCQISIIIKRHYKYHIISVASGVQTWRFYYKISEGAKESIILTTNTTSPSVLNAWEELDLLDEVTGCNFQVNSAPWKLETFGSMPLVARAVCQRGLVWLNVGQTLSGGPGGQPTWAVMQDHLTKQQSVHLVQSWLWKKKNMDLRRSGINVKSRETHDYCQSYICGSMELMHF